MLKQKSNTLLFIMPIGK